MYPAPWHETHGSFIHESARSLARLGVHVEVIRTVAWRPPFGSGGRREVPEERVLDGIRVRYVTIPHPPWPALACLRGPLRRPGLARAIYRAQVEVPFQLIHAHEIIPTGYAALPAARHPGLPLVCTAHGSDIYRSAKRAVCRGQAARVLAHADQVVAVSPDLASHAAQVARPRREIAVVPNGVDLDLFQPIPREESLSQLGLDDAPKVLYVGNLVAHKGVLDLLEAFAILSGTYPAAQLLYVGNGPLAAAITSRAAELHLTDRVRLVGARRRTEIPYWLAASAVCVIPSHSESFGIAALEAMACARPVLASRVGGLPELIEDGVTGRLTPPHDPVSLAAAIGDLLANPANATRLGEAARGWVLDANLTWEDHARRLLAVYSQVLGGGRAA